MSLESHIASRLVTPRPDCLIWTGATDRGYGRISIGRLARRVHRVVWELKYGPIPDGLTIDHLCRIRACCNTEHMELVEHGENVKRAVPFRSPRLKTHCASGHEYTPENTYVRPSTGNRECRACKGKYRQDPVA